MMGSSAPPRVLLVVTQSELGGAQRYVLTLAVDLKRRGAEVVIACGQGGGLVDEARAVGIEVVVLPYLIRPIRPLTDVEAIVSLARLIRHGRFDVVHLNSTKAGIVGRLAARAAGTKIVFFTVHGFVLNEPMSRPSFAVYWLLERIGAMATTRLIAVSDADRSALVRYRISPSKRIAVVHNGVETNRPEEIDATARRCEARARLGLPGDARVIGTIANHYRTKGLDVLIDAAERLTNNRPGVRIVIIGDGPERPRLEASIARLNAGDRVRLVGAFPNARDLLPAFDVFMLPSRKEGLPIALLEAMAAGLPVVVTSVGGMPEVVTPECGMVVPPENPEVLADAGGRVLDDPALAGRYGAAARDRVVSRFTAQHMLSETVRIYDKELCRIGAAPLSSMLEGAVHP